MRKTHTSILSFVFSAFFGTSLLCQEMLDGLQIGTGSAVTIVMLHGDEGRGGDPTTNHTFGAEIARRLPDATIHMLLRPGYRDPWGRQSPGDNFGRRDQYTTDNAQLILDTLRHLKGQSPLIAVGHSGGAAQLALAISMEPGIVDEAIFISCPCDLLLWREMNPDWPSEILVRSVSAVDSTPPIIDRVTLLVGANDTVTPPQLSRSYADFLAFHEIEHELVVVPEGDHSGNRALSQAWLSSIFEARQRVLSLP